MLIHWFQLIIRVITELTTLHIYLLKVKVSLRPNKALIVKNL